MNGTQKQIEYAGDLLAQWKEGLAAWKAMLPTGNPQATALIARMDAAAAKAETMAAGDVIEILQGRRADQATGTELVKWAGFAMKTIEGAK